MSRNNRQAISDAFAGHLDAVLAVDEIARRLEPNVRYGERLCVDFYRTPYRAQWQKPSQKMDDYVSWAPRFSDALDTSRMQWLEQAQQATEVIQ